MKNLISLLLFSLFIASCSTTSYVSPKKDTKNGVGKFLSEGKEIALSVEDSSTVAFFGERENKEITLFVFFKNESQEQYINVFPEDVKVYGIESDGSTKQLHTYNPKRYLKKMRNQQNLALALSAFGKAMEDMDAGTSTTTTYGTAYGSDGTSYNYYGNSTTTDESEKRAAQAENQRQLNKQARQAELYRNSVKEGLLMKTTLFPGSYIAGNIIFKHKSFSKYRLEVPVGDEIHEVYFELIKI
ncbi:hypothetical protein ACKGJO_13045 [Gracilimonas sp. Q87]|uniref:hypothetical protein n=1 Tax=Gracilimonas sp. Q87 TaxID=3384766 RepID=UPI0039840492